MIVLLILVFGVMGYFQFSVLIRKKNWHDLAWSGVFFLIAFVLFFLYTLGVQLPDPMKGIKNVLDALNLHFNM